MDYGLSVADQMKPSTKRQSIPIAYITQSFPALTITFIYREIFALGRQGFDIATYAIWQPIRERLSQESRHLVDDTHYVFPLSWPKFLFRHLYFLLAHPIKYTSTALFVLTRRGESPKNRVRTLFHFAEAVYLAKEMKTQGIKHIHAHFTINAASIALIISRLLDISFSFTAHSNLFTDRLILREKTRQARFVVAIAEITRQYLIDLVSGENLGDKIHIVHCGLSPQEFVPPSVKPASDIPMILFVAQLAERKGAPVLVEACKLLTERGLTFRCVLAGDGPQRTLIEQLVQEYELQNVVQMTGAVFQEQLQEYLSQADVFALPCIVASNGDMDGIPVSLMEAMAMEIPTVSTNVSGIPELIEDGQNGLLVPDRDPVALADALQRLLEDEKLCTRLGKNGRQKILREFDIDQNAALLAALFERYLSSDE